LLWIAVILAVSSIPGPTLQQVSFSVRDGLAHFVEYAVLGFLSYRLLRAEGYGVAAALAGAVMVGAVMGAIDENYQRLIPGRLTTWADYAADLAGSALGSAVAALYYMVTGRFRERSENQAPAHMPGGGEPR